MAIESNAVVDLNDVSALFKKNVADIVVDGAYSAGEPPKVSGTAGTFQIPAADLGTRADVEVTNLNFGERGGIIKGTTVFNVMMNALKNFSRVRKFTFELYYNSNSGNRKEKTLTGKAVFTKTLPTVPSGYTRNLNGSLMTVPAVKDTISGTTPDPGDMVQLCTNMLNAWDKIAKTELKYQYMSCHSSCHSSHSNRGRR